MNLKELYDEIFDLTQNPSIFIKETPKHLKIWASTENSDLYTFYIDIDIYNTYIEVRNFTVDFSIRKQGYGGKFYNIIESYFKSQGYDEILLHLVLTGAEKFWLKKGFKKDLGWKKSI